MLRRCQALAPGLSLAPEKVRLCALSHDLFRASPPDELQAQAQSYGLAIHSVEKKLPMLLHGPLAAHFLKAAGVGDEDVLQAVAWHTTGRAGMSPLEKVLFICDKVEPEKARGVPELRRAWRLAAEDVDRALLAVLNWQIASVRAAGQPLHPATLEARDSLLSG